MTPIEVRRWRLGPVLVALVLAAGCASTPDDGERERERDGEEEASDERSTLDRIREELDAGIASNRDAAGDGEPADLDDQLMPDVSDDEAGDLPDDTAEPRFDLAVDEVAARSFFRGLVEDTPYNIVVHPDVEGTLSLDLKDVTVPEVMRLVRRVHGYEYERDGDTYIVSPARLQSQIFQVDYLNVSRDGESSTSVGSGEVSSADDGDSEGDGGGSRSGSRRPNSRIETTSESNFWPSLQGTLSSMVGDGDGREVMVDPQAGLVVVRAMPGELRDVREYLSEAQKNLQRQVILEAKILEVDLSDNFQSGVNWAALGSGTEGEIGALQTSLSDGSSTVLDDDGAFDPSSLTNASEGDRFDFGGLFAIGARTGDFASVIRLLDSQGDVDVLSSPRVSTINNQKAVIKVGDDEFFVTDVSTDDTTSSVGTQREGIDVDLTPFFSGISLDVTPQISSDDVVTLHVHPAVSEVVDQQKNLVIGGEDQSLPLALSSVRESDSIVRARDGQVIVIGGLMQDESRRGRAQPGFLGDLPLIGGAFRQRQRESSQSELVILLRPLLADEPGDWADAIDGSAERLDDWREEDE